MISQDDGILTETKKINFKIKFGSKSWHATPYEFTSVYKCYKIYLEKLYALSSIYYDPPFSYISSQYRDKKTKLDLFFNINFYANYDISSVRCAGTVGLV